MLDTIRKVIEERKDFKGKRETPQKKEWDGFLDGNHKGSQFQTIINK